MGQNPNGEFDPYLIEEEIEALIIVIGYAGEKEKPAIREEIKALQITLEYANAAK